VRVSKQRRAGREDKWIDADMCIVRKIQCVGQHVYLCSSRETVRLDNVSGSVGEDGRDGQNRRQADKQTDRQLERSDDLTIQREIVKGLMVMEERVQFHRQIIRQAANAELLAVDR